MPDLPSLPVPSIPLGAGIFSEKLITTSAMGEEEAQSLIVAGQHKDSVLGDVENQLHRSPHHFRVVQAQ